MWAGFADCTPWQPEQGRQRRGRRCVSRDASLEPRGVVLGSMCFMCPPRDVRDLPKLFNITGIPLATSSSRRIPPPPPAAAHSATGALLVAPDQSMKPPSARYNAFKMLKAQRKAAAAAVPEPEPEPQDALVAEMEALELANSAAERSTSGRAAGRRVGCCIIDSVDGAGEVLIVSSNAWDLPLAPNTGICAERRALAALMLHGKLDESARWTMVVSHSPCVHCASTILLFPEIRRIVYGQGAPHRDPGVEMLRQAGRAVEQLEGLPKPLSPNRSENEQQQAPKRPRPLPEPTALQTCELRNRGGSLLYRGTTSWLESGVGCADKLVIDARSTLIAAARHAATHSGFVEAPGLAEGCSVRVDQPLNYLEKLFFSTCGVKVEVVPVDGTNSDLATTETEQARTARQHRLSAETSYPR